MLKSCSLSLVMIMTGIISTAQNRTREFLLTPPEQKIPYSLYKSITLVDNRPDTSNMGIVQTGAFNAKAFVKASGNFEVQLNTVLSQMADTLATNGELVLLLHQLSFAEVTGALSEKGYYYFSADMYAKAAAGYQKLCTVDTVVTIKAMDVTRALFRHGSKTITDFFQEIFRKSRRE